jgi:hypothetical protein
MAVGEGRETIEACPVTITDAIGRTSECSSARSYARHWLPYFFDDFFAADFLPDVFLVPDFLAARFFVDLFAADCFVAFRDGDFFADAFFGDDFLAGVFFADFAARFFVADFVLRFLPDAFDALFGFGGTLSPSRRASDSAIAIACLRLVTFLCDPPLRSFPALRSSITFLTFACVFFPYFATKSSSFT